MNDIALVAGAGPVGMTMAMALKRLGVDVRIIDKTPARTDKSKALVIWPRTLELLDIQGCVDDFIAAGIKGMGAHIIANGRERVHLRFDIARSVYRYALLIPQNETERVLEAQLAELGVHVERQVELQTFTQDDAGVSAALLHADGTQENLRACYLLGCDGAHSAVRHKLNAQFDGSTQPSDWVLGDVRLEGDLAPDELVVCWTEQGVLALFPIIGNRFRVLGDLGPSSDTARPPPSLADIQALLDARGPRNLRAHDPFWLSYFRINERKVKDYRLGRVFLSGDAAHIHSPAGGQGMNTGMQDAFNLAWKLAMVWHGTANASLLNSYSQERSAIGDQVLKSAGRLTTLATLHSPLLQELRNIAVGTLGNLGAVQQVLVDQMTEVDLHYPDSPLTSNPPGASHHPASGARATDLAVSTTSGATRLHALLATGRFAVLSVGAPRVELPWTLAKLATAASADNDTGYAPGHVFLVRPDAYVAMSTAANDATAITQMLQALLPPAT